MKRIRRFEVKIIAESRVRMPVGAKILPHIELAVGGRDLLLWAVVDDTAATEWVEFRVVGDNNDPFPAETVDYVGTRPDLARGVTWHLFKPATPAHAEAVPA